MNYMTYNPVDFINGEGTRCSIFVSGCEHHCHKCFNAKSFPFDAGSEFNSEIEKTIINDLTDTRIKRNGLSILGGEPLHPKNLNSVLKLVKLVRSESPQSDIWLWTGYRLEELEKEQLEVVNYLDVLIDGRFDHKLADPSLKWRGSSNQRVIYLK